MRHGELTVYRNCTPVIDREYRDEDDRAPSEVIVEAVAAAAGVDPTDLPPLYDFVDPDALDSLFDTSRGRTDPKAVLSFRMDTWNVFVRGDGKIRVCDGTRQTEPEPVFESSAV